MTDSRLIQYLDRGEGRIAYDLQGDGPLVVCIPGMGDLRSVYRFLVPELVAAGYRVVSMDLRGHGDSDASFRRYDIGESGGDVVALLDHLGGQSAVLVGHSMGAGAAVWAAAEVPDRVAGVVLIGPFAKDAQLSLTTRLIMWLGLRRPWGASVWQAAYAGFYPVRRPADFAEHRRAVRDSVRRPEHWRAFVDTVHQTSGANRLGEVRAPALVVMGERDPDFPDPAEAAALAAELLGGEPRPRVVMVPDSGHMPQADHPEVVGPAIQEFLRNVVHAERGK